MVSIEKIIETINHDIQLHENLYEMIFEEYNCFKEGEFDNLPEKGRDRILLEREIEKTNNTIVDMLSTPDIKSEKTDEKNIEKVTRLIQTLREKIKETMSIVEKSVAYMEKEKFDAGKQLRSFDKKRKLINSYAIYDNA
ncbi:hypothetical protein ACFL50_02330 [Candidatus Latescibacterota bacterium]